VAGVREPEFLQEDHGAGVRGYGEGFDLRRGGGHQKEEEECGDDGGEGGFPHF